MPRRVLAVGDRVQLTDPKGRHHTLTLEAGRLFHTHKGALAHDDLIGSPEGVVVTSTGNVEFLALRPLLQDFVLSMPRGATVVYPKDAAQIVGLADIFPGALVVEAGAGSAALTCSLLRAVGEQGRLVSYERRPDFAEVAATNVETFFGGPHPAWELVVGDIGEADLPADVDRVVLDLLAPWDLVDQIGRRPDAWWRASAATSRRPRRCRGSSRPFARTPGSPSRTPARRWSAPGTSRASRFARTTA